MNLLARHGAIAVGGTELRPGWDMDRGGPTFGIDRRGEPAGSARLSGYQEPAPPPPKPPTGEPPAGEPAAGPATGGRTAIVPLITSAPSRAAAEVHLRDGPVGLLGPEVLPLPEPQRPGGQHVGEPLDRRGQVLHGGVVEGRAKATSSSISVRSPCSPWKLSLACSSG